MIKLICAVHFFTLMFCVSACAAIGNIVEEGGKTIDGSRFLFKTEQRWRTLDNAALDLRVGKDREGSEAVMWTHPKLPYLVFYGTIPAQNGIFEVTKVHFLAGSYGGWNEYECAASGRGRFRRYNDNNASWTLLTPIERGDINYGKVRRADTRLIGDRAVSALRGRDERIRYLTKWMRELNPKNVYNEQSEFERYWKPRLFPRTKSQKRDAPALPELLQSEDGREALNSDWDEASSWIYVDYDWYKITSLLSNEYIITKE